MAVMEVEVKCGRCKMINRQSDNFASHATDDSSQATME